MSLDGRPIEARLIDENGDAVNPLQERQAVHFSTSLKRNGDDSMDVNGSSTNRSFKWEVPSGEVWLFEATSLYIYKAVPKEYNKFGDISALSNGLQLNVQIDGTKYTIHNLKNNVDILTNYACSVFGSETDVVLGAKQFFGKPIRLTGDDGDFVEGLVRDNLSGLDELKMVACLTRFI